MKTSGRIQSSMKQCCWRSAKLLVNKKICHPRRFEAILFKQMKRERNTWNTTRYGILTELREQHSSEYPSFGLK